MTRQTDLPRFHVDSLAGPTIELAEGEAHHALHVLRLKVGASVELFDGLGRWAEGRIIAADRRTIAAEADVVHGPVEPPRPRVTLAFAPPKGKRLDWLLEKAGELGAARLVCLRTARGVAEPGGANTLRRWQAICVGAIRQSRQLHLPVLDEPLALAAFLARPIEGLGILADCRADTPPVASLPGLAGCEAATILIGPEGGWTDDEADAAGAAGYRPARVGESVLRVETAAVAALAAVRALSARPG